MEREEMEVKGEVEGRRGQVEKVRKGAGTVTGCCCFHLLNAAANIL